MKASHFHGFLVIDKPGGMTSRDVVDRAQRWFPRGTKLGHTGTLDPLATGVLVLCIGAATRLAEYVQDMAKTYRAGLLLGARSDTDDADGTVTRGVVDKPPDRAAVEEQMLRFIGEIDQVPPAYSAAKVTGRRAYALARRGQEVALLPRRVRIHRIEVHGYEYPRLELEVHCGKGTYIRSLARDLGERLGCGALIEALRRTRVGPFDAAEAFGLDADATSARSRILPLAAAVAELPHFFLQPGEAARLRHGESVPLPNSWRSDGPVPGPREVGVFDTVGNLVAVAAVDQERGCLHPLKVLPGN